MLNGPELGAALDRAMQLKEVTQKEVAAHFGVKQPSVSEWIRFGRIKKSHIDELVAYFSTHVGPDHWGLDKVAGLASGTGQSDQHLGSFSGTAYATVGLTLSDALDRLELALAALPIDGRAAVAANLSGWANEGGGGRWRTAIDALLTTPSRKDDAKAA